MGRSEVVKPAHASAGEKPPRQRLDLWLWHARFLSRRKDCAALVEAGFVRVNTMRVTQPGHAVKIGDVLTLALPGQTVLICIAGFSDRRGDAGVARDLFRRVDPAQ